MSFFIAGSSGSSIFGVPFFLGWDVCGCMCVAVERLDVAMTMYPSSDPRAGFPGYSAWPYTNRGHMPYIES